MKNKRLICMLLAAMMILSVLSGCGAKSSSTTLAETADTASEAVDTASAAEPEDAGTADEETGEVVELDDVEEGPEIDLGDLLDEGVPLAAEPVLMSSLTPVASGTQTKKNSSTVIDYSNTKDGYVMVSWTEGGSAKLKVLIKGPSGTQYQYNLRSDGQYETFPLSDGSGNYTVGVYKNVSGSKYSTILSASFSAKLTDEFAPFLRANQYVNFTDSSKAVAKAAELCKGAKNNLDKVDKVYTYVIKNTTYDTKKAETVQSGYLPNVDDTLKTGKGICFDYAALMAAMLRSQGVPVKLIVGYTGSAYHAWINVYSETDGWIEGKIYFDGKEWKLMDPTFASTAKSSDSIMKYIGNGDNYQAKYQY